MKLIFLCFIMIYYSLFPAYSQSVENCRNILGKACGKYHLLPTNDRRYYVKYHFTINMRDKRFKTINTECEMACDANTMRLRTDVMEVFRDSINTYTILASEKTIYVTNSKIIENPMDKMNFFALARDSILLNSDILECKSSSNNNGQINISIRLNLPAIPELNGAEITYLIKKRNYDVIAISVEMPKVSSIISMNIKVIKTDFEFLPGENDFVLSNPVLIESGKLKKKYQGFKILDARKSN